jgi:hypothetical protein
MKQIQMKKLFFLLLVLIQTPFASGQTNYYVLKDKIYAGIKIKDGSKIENAKQCQIIKKGILMTYTPSEVSEYGFKDGRIYISKVIKTDNEEKNVFLESINKGNLNLYYYKDRSGSKFFLEKDSGALEEFLRKNNDRTGFTYRDQIKNYVQDCDKISDALKLFRYNKPSLKKFIDQYNSCKQEPFPFFRYGFMICDAIDKPLVLRVSDKVLKGTTFKFNNSLNAGLFIDIPILLSNTSFHPEIYFQKNTFISHSVTDNLIYDININTSSVNVPLLIRYTYPSLKYRPFADIGGTYSSKIKNKCTIYTTEITDNIVDIEKSINDNPYSQKRLGFSAGAGIQYNIDYRKSVFLELRFNSLYALTKEALGNKSIQFLISFNL